MVTTALHHIEEGSEVGIRGPLGNGYPMDLFKGKNVLVIGGGFAFTTLRSLIAYLLHPENRSKVNEITVIYGARMPGLLLYKEELTQWEKRSDLKLMVTVDWGIKIGRERWGSSKCVGRGSALFRKYLCGHLRASDHDQVHLS